MSLAFERVGAQPVPDHARQHRVRMRDGILLATDVYPAEGSGPVPTVLIRLPYDKNSRYVFLDKAAERFTARGYTVAVQDVRGKFRSGGHTLGWTGEVDDAYDTLEWITRQSWSDGIVGMFGDSYYGFTQWSAVSAQHPALRAIVPRVTSTNVVPGVAAYDVGGPQPVWLEGADYQAHVWIDNDSYEFEPDWSRRPFAAAYEEAFAGIGKRSAGFDLVVGGIPLAAYNGPHPYHARPVPVLHCVGWFDNLGIAHMRDYTELAKRPGWAAVQYLDADATDHENYFLADGGITPDADHMADDAALDRMLDAYTGPALEFFDVFLRAVAKPETLPRVRWTLGHVGRRTAGSWPPPGARTVDLHLAESADANGPVPGGALVAEAPTDAGAAHWRYDPDDLVPSAATNTFMLLRDHADERATAERDDVLVFTGPARDRPLDLAGPVHAELHVDGEAPAFDIFVRLLDLAPDGTARLILRGCAQVSGPGPRHIGPRRVELGHTGYRLRPGHRLLLMIAGSDFPNHLPNSGTAENPWLTVAPKASLQTLRTGAGHPSRLTLTVLPDAGDDAGTDAGHDSGHGSGGRR